MGLRQAAGDKENGTLGFWILHLARQRKPPMLLLENVRDWLEIGLTKARGRDGSLAAAFMKRMEESGYHALILLLDVQWYL